MLNGTHCQFDESRQPERKDFAETVVEYTDRKVPALFGLLGLPIPAAKVLIRFAPISGGQFVHPNVVELGNNHQPNDLGCIIHECVHWAQQPDLGVYGVYKPVFEGVADYYRIVLSDDRQGDYISDGKRNLVPAFSPDEVYDSGSEFIAHLRRRSGNEQFVRELNNALRTNDIATIDQFFNGCFGRSFGVLLADYPSQRKAAVGDRPCEVSRFDFFTELA